MQPFRELISRNQTNWAVIAAAGTRLGGEGVSGSPARRAGRAACGTRSTACAAWIGPIRSPPGRNTSTSSRRARTISIGSTTTRCAIPGPGTELTIGLPAGARLGERPHDQPIRDSVHGEPADRRGVHDPAQGSRGRHGPLDEAPQLRRHAHRGLQPPLQRGTRRRGQGGARRSRCCVNWSRPIRAPARLGEIALVPHSSPVSQSGRLFYNTLFDENAATHVALGAAYKFTLRGAESMDEDAFGRGRRQPQHHPRRLHDRLGRSRHRRRARERHQRAAHAPRRVVDGGLQASAQSSGHRRVASSLSALRALRSLRQFLSSASTMPRLLLRASRRSFPAASRRLPRNRAVRRPRRRRSAQVSFTIWPALMRPVRSGVTATTICTFAVVG